MYFSPVGKCSNSSGSRCSVFFGVVKRLEAKEMKQTRKSTIWQLKSTEYVNKHTHAVNWFFSYPATMSFFCSFRSSVCLNTFFCTLFFSTAFCGSVSSIKHVSFASCHKLSQVLTEMRAYINDKEMNQRNRMKQHKELLLMGMTKKRT